MRTLGVLHRVGWWSLSSRTQTSRLTHNTMSAWQREDENGTSEGSTAKHLIRVVHGRKVSSARKPLTKTRSYQLLSLTIARGRLRGSRPESVTGLKRAGPFPKVYISFRSSADYLESASNLYLPRTTAHDIGVVWVCPKRVPITLTYSDSMPVLKTRA